ncbi:alpha/beta hydrolase [Photorhabdus heterorhabditis]|uniref:Uncharacterized protein n=1 Tax=Photorhabdus heterorhabditis TaxID=880156 RepID=A0A5B0VRT8_9GAMM|nr:hypothetical protein [Photorhabdus heterorhabditis]KAA1177327.1 hypothetical protein F0L16_19465 [Photorhabdus heterorhabditis]
MNKPIKNASSENNLFCAPYVSFLKTIQGETLLSWIIYKNGKTLQEWFSIEDNKTKFLYSSEKISFNNAFVTHSSYLIYSNSNIIIINKNNIQSIKNIKLRNVKKLVTDNKNNIFIHAGRKLYISIEPKYETYRTLFSNVDCMTYFNDSIIMCEVINSSFLNFKEINQQLEIIREFSFDIKFNLNEQKIDIQVTNQYIYIFIEPKFHVGHINSLSIIEINRENHNNIKIKKFPPFIHLGFKGSHPKRFDNRILLLITEIDEDISLICYNFNNNKINKISLPKQDVLSYCFSVSNEDIYYTALDSSKKLSARNLYHVKYNGNEFFVELIHRNIGGKFSTRTPLGYIFESYNTDKKIFSIQSDKKNHCNFHINKKSLPLSVARNNNALIYYPGMHKYLTNNTQDNYFQESLLRLQQSFNEYEMTPFLFNTIGAMGKGKSYRESVTPSNQEFLINYLHEFIKHIQESGFSRIFILSGSLGALSILEYLNYKKVTASFLINPVYDLNILNIHSSNSNINADSFSEKITTDMLILHGREDEVAPWEQSVKFTIGHQNRKLVTIENEGHIFNFGNSWNICRREILDFVDNIKQ